ncbi:hypothetical protein MRX96_021826 [Rhipicephalus microplus]
MKTNARSSFPELAHNYDASTATAKKQKVARLLHFSNSFHGAKVSICRSSADATSEWNPRAELSTQGVGSLSAMRYVFVEEETARERMDGWRCRANDHHYAAHGGRNFPSSITRT